VTVDRLLERWRRVPPIAADTVLAAVVGLVTVVSVVVDDQQDERLRITAFGWAMLVLQVVPLVWRRRAPVAVAIVSMVASAAYGIRPLPDPAIMFAPSLALYTVAAHTRRRTSVPYALITIAVAAVTVVVSDSPDAADVAVNYFVGITSWVVGDMVRGQRERAALVVAHRDEAVQRAASDERVRIARDLHDVVAHHVSVIVVQAEAAQEVLAAHPEQAGAAMATVADTARDALTELRRTMGVLRADATTEPQPDLASLDELADTIGRAGLPVTLHRDDRCAGVDPVVGLATYRVVQEALTNVLRHAPTATQAVVDVSVDGGALLVTVSDDGPLVHAPGETGLGLVGMRERVGVLGGSLDAGPRPAGGFEVRARLPLGP
jgi:signal transduction histidine kinase